jgi:cytochrome P450
MNANTVDPGMLVQQFDLSALPPDFYADPYPWYRALQERQPVKRMRNGAYFLTRYDDVVAVYKNPRVFSSD